MFYIVQNVCWYFFCFYGNQNIASGSFFPYSLLSLRGTPIWLKSAVIIYYTPHPQASNRTRLVFTSIWTFIWILKVILHQFWVKKIFPWKFNLEYGGTFTKLFMHVSSRNMFRKTRNLQICVHVYHPRHCCGDWLTFCFVPIMTSLRKVLIRWLQIMTSWRKDKQSWMLR